MRFLIASRLPLPGTLLNDPTLRKNLDRIEIRCGRPLGNDEINRCYLESFCVWNIYRRSTQSGVLPKAFMFGTPVIASRVGAFPEWVEEGVNGRFAEARDCEGILAALEDIRNNIEGYATRCRQTFIEKFFYRSNLAAIQRSSSDGAMPDWLGRCCRRASAIACTGRRWCDRIYNRWNRSNARLVRRD